ncbi:uncharacterized protein LOC133845132 [Drosophila sulfurigaster albostrigata]|uniref:uncharacterized protein LOC133845132 n=1 Tax=Drosophila sulfurigaster albostrigata TaxID=89887 RepID=UPI002D21EAD5|nr:uncharacterized protein LOC133845132 [Drosophila sulfurigaster albostrigata]
MPPKKTSVNQLYAGYKATYQKPMANSAYDHMSISNSYGRAAETPIFQAPVEPKQRGRPRKNAASTVAKAEESVATQVARSLVRSLKDNKKPLLTENHGFNRNQKPDYIVSGFYYEEQLVFAVRFKGRKTPDFICAKELKLRAPELLINFYESRLHYTHND